jgi:hypothetical protein
LILVFCSLFCLFQPYSLLIPALFFPFFFRPHDVRFLCPPTRLR